MNKKKGFSKFRYSPKNTIIITIVFIGTLINCSSVNNELESISNQDLDIAVSVVALSISDYNSGLINSLYDALIVFNENNTLYQNENANLKDHSNFEQNSTKNWYEDEKSGRGLERDLIYTYDPVNGTHYFEYVRTINKNDYFSETKIDQEFVFTNNEGNYIEHPLKNKRKIDSVSYKGSKVSILDSPKRTLNISRYENFQLSNFQHLSEYLHLKGTQISAGDVAVTLDETQQIERSFNVELTFQNIKIEKSIISNSNSIESVISGSLTFKIDMFQTNNDKKVHRTLEGVIYLSNNDEAFIRFDSIFRAFNFSLRTGEIIAPE